MRSSISTTAESESRSIQAIVANFNSPPGEVRLPLSQFWDRLKSYRSLTLLASLVKVELQQRFKRGERPTVAEYLQMFPQLTGDRDRVTSLVYEEFCLLEENHVGQSVSEFCNRYEPWRDSLLSQIGYHRELSQIVGTAQPKISFPAVGDRFGKFRLDSILGRGGAAQVYLATEDLGPRTVVLKVAPLIGVEPAILARLDHPNIVPILSLEESPGLGLHGICMPYKPGLTLETLLDQIKATGTPRRAHSIWNLREVRPAQMGLYDAGWQDFPIEGTYTEAIAWIVMSIARALAYLHHEGVVHRDIKPANIWLAHRDGPLLFDFNLAHQPSDPEHAQAALAGGTLPYMAPEQLRAFLDPQYWDAVNASSDIYALGLVLRELVTGAKPDLPRPDLPLTRAIQDLHDRRHTLTVSCRVDRPEIPPSLDAIILKCLAFAPEGRYKNAADLAEDLQSFLRRELLTYAANSSRLEVTINWSYRRHKWIAMVALLLLSGLLLCWQREQPLTDAMVQEGVQLLESRDENEWRQARQIFTRLAQRYPDNAEPLLYLGHVCYRLKQKDDGSRHIKQAFGKKDFEEAIRKGLHRTTDSIQLRMTLCEYYLYSKNDLPNARKVAMEVLQVQPDHFGAQKFLGDIEIHSKNYQQSVGYYETAIRLATTQKAFGEADLMRTDLVRILLMDLDGLLNREPNLTQRNQAATVVQRVGKHIQILKSRGEGTNRDLYANSLMLCMEGSWMADSAYLKVLNAEKTAAIADFQAARRLFETVRNIATQGKVPADQAVRLKGLADNQVTDLDRRLRACAIDDASDRKSSLVPGSVNSESPPLIQE